jgi:hypothetical protein
MVISDNGSVDEYFVRLRNCASLHSKVPLLERTQTEFGSFGKREALNVLVHHIDTRFGLILDADCLPLMFGWNAILFA